MTDSKEKKIFSEFKRGELLYTKIWFE
jgi:hypothetical protein